MASENSPLPLATFIYLHELTLMGFSIRCSYCYVGCVEPIIEAVSSNVNDHHCPVEREERARWIKLRSKKWPGTTDAAEPTNSRARRR